MSSLSPTATPFIQALPLDKFWASIDSAWETIDGGAAIRDLIPPIVIDKFGRKVYDKRVRGTAVGAIREHLPSLINVLKSQMATYSASQIRAWHRHMHQAVWTLDAGHVPIALGADTDDKYLHARAFVVACGRTFYKTFMKNPEGYSLGWVWPEDVLNLAMVVYKERYGNLEYPPTREPVVNISAPPKTVEDSISNHVDASFATPEPSPTKTLVGTPSQNDIKIYDASSNDKEGIAHLATKAVEHGMAYGGEGGLENGVGEDDGGW